MILFDISVHFCIWGGMSFSNLETGSKWVAQAMFDLCSGVILFLYLLERGLSWQGILFDLPRLPQQAEDIVCRSPSRHPLLFLG
jgi:hypothetical protein